MDMFDFTVKRNEHYKYLREKHYSINYNIRLNPFKETKERCRDLLKIKKEKKSIWSELRGSRMKCETAKIEEYLNSDFLNTETALQIGLIDAFHSVYSFRFERYPNRK